MNKTTQTLLIFAAAGVAIWFFFFRKPPGADGATANAPGNGFALTTPGQAVAAAAGNPKGFNYSAYLASLLAKSGAGSGVKNLGGQVLNGQGGNIDGLISGALGALKDGGQWVYDAVSGLFVRSDSPNPPQDTPAEILQNNAWDNIGNNLPDVPPPPIPGDAGAPLTLTLEVKAPPAPAPAVNAAKAKPLRNKYALAAIAANSNMHRRN